MEPVDYLSTRGLDFIVCLSLGQVKERGDGGMDGHVS